MLDAVADFLDLAVVGVEFHVGEFVEVGECSAAGLGLEDVADTAEKQALLERTEPGSCSFERRGARLAKPANFLPNSFYPTGITWGNQASPDVA